MLDDERLKQGKAVFGKDYFRELLERVRSIRASERRIWQQITDIYAECSYDYDRNSPTTREFYQMIQNRFHYAITGQTAPEIIYTRADHSKEHMGLQTWKNAPDGRILLSDTKIAKNYLPEKEIRQLERAVTGYFDYIEDLIERENAFNMELFAASVNEFLTQNEIVLSSALILVSESFHGGNHWFLPWKPIVSFTTTNGFLNSNRWYPFWQPVVSAKEYKCTPSERTAVSVIATASGTMALDSKNRTFLVEDDLFSQKIYHSITKSVIMYLAV